FRAPYAGHDDSGSVDRIARYTQLQAFTTRAHDAANAFYEPSRALVCVRKRVLRRRKPTPPHITRVVRPCKRALRPYKRIASYVEVLNCCLQTRWQTRRTHLKRGRASGSVSKSMQRQPTITTVRESV